MGGGNGQKSKAAREKAAKRDAKPKGSQLAMNSAACNIVCQVCRQTFMMVANETTLREHALNKHPKSAPSACFPDKLT
ncbi:At2g23090 like protein [Tribonema minus]|uniref:At2g23090 like protein n=1 Tax=Tribonema minus TaxID=303371 RepID=A0A836C7H0_9STRA|nr:At2g23090 like protein [Tribonema minus]